MAKKIAMKSNRKDGKVNNKKSAINKKAEQQALEIMERGETFGDVIIDVMMMTVDDWKGMGAAASGLAKAWAALKQLAKTAGVDVEFLFEKELAHFEKVYSDITDEMGLV